MVGRRDRRALGEYRRGGARASIRTDEAQTECNPIGHAISLAARTEALAPIGSIAATRIGVESCEKATSTSGVGPARVKGVSEPVEIYEVGWPGPLDTRFQAVARRGLSRFVGRDTETREDETVAITRDSGHGQIVAAIGEPGVGKSACSTNSRPLQDMLY